MEDFTWIETGDKLVVQERVTRTVNRYEGEVTRVGRKLFDVEWFPWGDSHRSETKTFRLEDGRSNDKYGYYWVETPEREAEQARRAKALNTLHNAGLTVSRASYQEDAPSLGLLEALAAVIETWGQEGTA